MISCKLNGVERTDIFIQQGANISETADHKTSSSIVISVPIGETQPIEYDYLQIYDGATLIYAGTILGVSQQNKGYAALPEKVYSLNLANNVDYISTACVDLVIPQGANCNQIINGNNVTDNWFNNDLGEFDGIVSRLEDEGLTIGIIDDLGTSELSDIANLWGNKISDILDEVASIAGAWWEVTPAKVFNMRSNSFKDIAPQTIDATAEIYDLNVERDAYTLYSAVRVIGSEEGRGASYTEALTYDVTAPTTTDTATTTRDISAINNAGLYGKKSPSALLIMGYGGIKNTTTDPDSVYQVGVTGLHESDATYSYLYSNSSNEIKAKAGFEFTAAQEGNWFLSYYPVVPVISRIVDNELVEEIKTQRGGSGIIEYVLNDSNIKSFNEANAIGADFLKNNSKRAFTVNFKTKTAGFSVGQIIKDCDYSYYGILGDYEVTSITTVLTEIGGALQFVYEVEASTSAYRNELTAMQPRKQKFTLGTNNQYLPSAISLFAELEVITELTLQGIGPPTWAEFEATFDDWAELETTYSTWEDIEVVLDEVKKLGAYWTAEGKARFAKVMASTGASSQLIGTSHKIEAYNSADVLLASVLSVGTALPTADAAINTFYLYENQANDTISYIKVLSSDDVEIQRITDINFTKTDRMTLSISKKDEVQ